MVKSKQLPRFRRVAGVRSIDLTSRDRLILRLVHQHRFLRSSHIVAITSGSRQTVLRRLQLLYHHGYLERPRCQIDYYHSGGSREIAYGLGSKGATALKQEGVSVRDDWSEKNRAVKRMFLEHALMVSDFMVAVEASCREKGVKLLTPVDLGWQQPLRWRARLRSGSTLPIVPDRAFTLEHQDRAGQLVRTCFFLEADRGTMPVKRKNLSQTSMYRKFLAYEATWNRGLHQKMFGIGRFRVLTVTTAPKRLITLLDTCASLKSGRGLFLFADSSILRKRQDVFSHDWRNGNGVVERLLENSRTVLC
jgi:hypothetical protein